MILKVNNLVKRYKELIALDHFNMEVEEGEIEVFGYNHKILERLFLLLKL
ncbi:hypothetical protein [Sporanaerobacter acetigenes]